MKVYRILISPHDFLSFSSYGDYNAKVYVREIIGNYALQYAFADFSRHIAFNGETHYSELDELPYYITPARVLEMEQKTSAMNGIFHNKVITDGSQFPLVKITQNMISSRLVEETRRDKVETQVVQYQKIPPSYIFEAFILSKDDQWKPRRVIRIGKKGCISRIYVEELKPSQILHGEIVPDHIINPLDYKDSIIIRGGLIIPIPPVPLVSSSEVEGDYIIAKSSSKSYKILIPNRLKEAN